MPALVIAHRGIMPRIAADVFLAETAVVIGDVEIGPGSSIWYGCVVRGDVNRIRIGRNTNVQDGTVIHCNSDRAGDYRETGGGEPTVIGDDVVIGHMVLLHACTVGDRTFIGMGAAVLDRATVEADAMIAAGATVTPGKTVPTGQLWAGAPARFMRALGAADTADRAFIAAHYRELAAEYRRTDQDCP